MAEAIGGGHVLTDEGLERFAVVAAKHVGPDRVPGLVALVAHGDQVRVEVLGEATIGGPLLRRDSRFRISSVTKPITAAATLVLAAEGAVDLDEPVDRVLPELAGRSVLRTVDGPLDDVVPATRPITARDLLTFTFGFGMVVEMFMAPTPWPVVAAAQELRLATIGPPDPAHQADPDTWIAGFASLPLLAQPGERWMYNTGAQVLSVLLARAAGQPYADVLRTRIFEPLGMSRTAFWAPAGELPTAYVPTPDGLAVYDPPDGAWSRAPAFADGAAGLVSTADDLLAFARMLLRGGAPILSPAAVAAMTTDQLTAAQKSRGGLGSSFFDGRGWGFGGAVVTAGERAGAYGWDGALGSAWLIDPARDLTVITLCQRVFETSDPPAVHLELRDAAYAALAQ
jgi:CubicO group peptidase (beta-lactamase class C family)